MESDLARRSSFAPFSAFRPVNKISDILQLSSSQTKNLDSGEICEVSTTVDKDSEESTSKFTSFLLCKISREIVLLEDEVSKVGDEVIDVENEEKKEVKVEPQVIFELGVL